MKSRLLITVVAVGALARVASAVPIGTLDIAGLGNVRVSVNMIDFAPPGGGTGDFIVSGADGALASVPVGATGTITDLNIATAPPGPPLAVPINPFLLVPVPGPLFSYNLEQIFAGGGAPCTVAPGVGGSCTPSELVPNSPFLLTQNQGSVAVSFAVRGTVTDLSNGSTAAYKGLFTTNLTRANVDTIPEVLSALGPHGPGFVQASWSAEFTSSSAVPEPSTMFLLGAGLLLLGSLKFRKNLAK